MLLCLSRTASVFRPAAARYRHASTAASTIESAKNPDLFKGVLTKYGWVLVRNTHVARSWTQACINSFLEERLSPQQLANVSELQPLVDKWMDSADLKQKPKFIKQTAKMLQKEQELKLFLKQSKDEGKHSGVKATKAKSKAKRKVSSSEVTFTYAWNYFMAVTYPKHSELPPKEARKHVASIWRQMSMDEKDVYREEYAKLLSSGKDILHGEIVDREVKMKSTERLRLSKERSLQRKAEALKKLESALEP